MNDSLCVRCLGVAVTVGWLAGCGGNQPLVQPGSGATASVSQTSSVTTDARLYVGGLKVSEYRLGSIHPLHSASADGTAEAMAADSLGNLFAISVYGSSATALRIFDARTLKARPYSGPTGNAVAIDANNYIYLRGFGKITVLTPGAGQQLRVMRKGVEITPDRWPSIVREISTLATIRSSPSLPDQPPGYMKYVRRITHGVELPRASAFDFNDELYVANCLRFLFSQPGKRKDWISVYASNGSTPLRRFDDGAHGLKEPSFGNRFHPPDLRCDEGPRESWASASRRSGRIRRRRHPARQHHKARSRPSSRACARSVG